MKTEFKGSGTYKNLWKGDKISPDESKDKRAENENSNNELFDFTAIPLPETDNSLYSILNSLNQNIADFYTLVKFNNYLSEDHLNVELLRRSMSIHRDFAVLFLHTKEEMVFTVHSEFLEKVERLLFKGEVSNNCIKYTCKLCRTINDYKVALHGEGYLPDPKYPGFFT